MPSSRTILHCDMNNFFASVECLDRPDLKTRPMAVCGDPQKRHGIILAKNEIAKKFGVKTGETISDARCKCPFLELVPSHYEKYAAFSGIAKEIYQTYTDQVEGFGMDECWLDVTESASLFGDGEKIANELRERIRRETGLTISAGVSYNKTFAKMGSDYKKPDATTVIDRQNYRAMLWPLDVSKLLYVGHSTAQRFHLYGIQSIGDLAESDSYFIAKTFGKNGIQLQQIAQGHDTGIVRRYHQNDIPKSISNGITAIRDLKHEEDVSIVLSVLCDSVAARLRRWQLKCGTITVSFRKKDLSQFQRSRSVETTYVSSEIYHTALTIYRQAFRQTPILRSLSVSAERLVPEESRQISLFDGSLEQAKRENLEHICDSLRKKYGTKILRPALTLLDRELSGFSPDDDARFQVFSSQNPRT